MSQGQRQKADGIRSNEETPAQFMYERGLSVKARAAPGRPKLGGGKKKKVHK